MLYQLVFSSSSCVYANPERLLITEDSLFGNVINVRGRSKYLIEDMLMCLSRSHEVWVYDVIFVLHETFFS